MPLNIEALDRAMAYEQRNHGITDEDRRDFLKALGIGGTVGVSGVTLNEVRDAVSTPGTVEELAPIGQAVKNDLTGAIDGAAVAEGQEALADAASALSASLERGLPAESEGPREEFAAVAEAGRPVYEHLREVGFFESTTEHLPAFDIDVLASSLQTVVASDEIVGILEGSGITEEQSIDLLATVIGNAEELVDHHWVATEELPGEANRPGEAFPTASQAAAGGTLLWLEDLDTHLYQKAVLMTESIHGDAVWHGQAMGAGLYLMSEGASRIGEERGSLSEGELGALLTTSFAVQAVSQGQLPQDVYWITERMRGPRA